MFELISNDYFNSIEAVFWMLLGVGCLISASVINEQFKTLARYASVVLVLFGVSDVLQVIYGSFLVPDMQWLLVWKVVNVVALAAVFVWYAWIRMYQSRSIASSTDTGQ